LVVGRITNDQAHPDILISHLVAAGQARAEFVDSSMDLEGGVAKWPNATELVVWTASLQRVPLFRSARSSR
jgi:hypothetical protein